jgi:hypothetical protein
MNHNILIAFTNVDPAAHGGWDGRSGCDGCHHDARIIATRIAERTVVESSWCRLFDADGTTARIDAALEGTALGAQAGDLVHVYWTGHGGQRQAHGNHNEADGREEHLVTWDGEFWDDRIWKIMCQFAAGVNVIFVTDTCFSGGAIRGRPRWFPFLFSRKLRQDRQPVASVLHWAACREFETSGGTASGGVFTRSVYKVTKPRTIDYDSANTEVVRRLRAAGDDQRPQMSVYGPHGEALLNRRVWA